MNIEKIEIRCFNLTIIDLHFIVRHVPGYINLDYASNLCTTIGEKNFIE